MVVVVNVLLEKLAGAMLHRLALHLPRELDGGRLHRVSPKFRFVTCAGGCSSNTFVLPRMSKVYIFSYFLFLHGRRTQRG